MSQGKSLLSHQNENPIEKKKSNLSGFGKFIWNSSKREFCGRDGASWGKHMFIIKMFIKKKKFYFSKFSKAKISLFYVVFYSLLGLFFIGLLAVFAAVMPLDKPTYYGEESVMNQAILNPGLGFRPQIDVEDNFIHYNPNIYEKSNKGFKQYVENLNHFLESSWCIFFISTNKILIKIFYLIKEYKQSEDSSKVIQCIDGNDYTQDLMSGKYCDFDFKKIFQETNCTKENNFGYETNNLCVLIKLNKIYSWKPTFNANEEKKIKIKCEGEV